MNRKALPNLNTGEMKYTRHEMKDTPALCNLMHCVFWTWAIKEVWVYILNCGKFKIASSCKIDVMKLMGQKRGNSNMRILPTEFLIGIGTGCQQWFSKIFIFLLVILHIILVNLCEALLQCKCSSALICHFTFIILVYFCYNILTILFKKICKRRLIKVILLRVLSIGHRIYNKVYRSSNCIK